MVTWIKGGIRKEDWPLVQKYLKREKISMYNLVQKAVLAYVKGERPKERQRKERAKIGVDVKKVEEAIATLPATPNVGKETAKICAEEAFRILLERGILDSGEIVDIVAERTGLKNPRKAITETLRAYKAAGILVGGGKGSTKYRLA
jgi:hypothetical protein